ncbi:MAG: Shedu immune nuclease family protein [Minisyncoccia bacterium]
MPKAIKPKIVRVKAKDGYLAFTINKKTEQIVYRLRGSQANKISKIVLKGFTEMPTGIFLNRGGYGFTMPSKGRLLIKHLEGLSKHNPIEFVITKDGVIGKKKLKNKLRISLPLWEVKAILADIRKIESEKRQEVEDKLNQYISVKGTGSKKIEVYTGGSLNSLLRKPDLLDNLNEDDIQELGDFIPKFFTSDLSKKIKKQREYKLQLAKLQKTESEKIYLDQVIEEFEELLGREKLKEEKWQVFLSEKVFPFLTNYTFFIEKERVSIKGSQPDFIAIDVYDFIDIYEIKTHHDNILAYDSSHKNYYWKPNIAQAISQVESYIDQVNDNTATFERYIKENYGKTIKVIRPRGYIIAGKSAEFSTDKHFKDFKRLSRSLKNIDFILYDELLESLKGLRNKL